MKKKILLYVFSLILPFLIQSLVFGGAVVSPQGRAAMKQRKMRQMGGGPATAQSATVQGPATAQSAQVQKLQNADINSVLPLGNSQEVKITPELIESLKKSSQDWMKLTSPGSKSDVVIYFIEEFKKNNIRIKKAPGNYVTLIDGMLSANPSISSNSLDKILQIVAIIEYDFDNGQDKDALARKVLGDEGFLKNKKRLGIQ